MAFPGRHEITYLTGGRGLAPQRARLPENQGRNCSVLTNETEESTATNDMMTYVSLVWYARIASLVAPSAIKQLSLCCRRCSLSLC
jgi:hypothetical protein